MDQEVFLIINGDEQYIGFVSEILNPKDEITMPTTLFDALRCAVEETTFNPEAGNIIPFAIELR